MAGLPVAGNDRVDPDHRQGISDLRGRPCRRQDSFHEQRLRPRRDRLSARRRADANSAEAWLGLAASYDRLRRFDMADRAYGQAFAFLKDKPAYYNNLGYSYLLRGDLLKARENFARARDLDPENVVVAHNIGMLRASIGYTAR